MRRRVAAVLFILCAGCASPGNDSLLEDSVFGDIRAMFSPSPTYTSSAVLNSSYPTTSSYTAPTPGQNQQQLNQPMPPP
jgi:hypothetical protein